MVGEVIESLDGVVGGGVEGYAVFRSGVNVFEDMEGGLVVLVGRICVVRCKKGECRCNVRASAGCQPI